MATATWTRTIQYSANGENTANYTKEINCTISSPAPMDTRFLFKFYYGTSDRTVDTLFYSCTRPITEGEMSHTFDLHDCLKRGANLTNISTPLFIQCKVSDAVGSEFITHAQSSIYKVTGQVTKNWDSDQNSSTSLISGRCGTKIFINYLKNSCMSLQSVSATCGTNTVSVTYTHTTTELQGTIGVVLNNDQPLPGNQTVVVNALFSDGYLQTTVTATRTSIHVPTLSSLVMQSGTTIDMYGSSPITFTMANSPCAISSGTPVSTANYYIETITLQSSNNSSTWTGTNVRTNITKTLTDISASQTLTATVQKNNFCSFNEWGRSTFYGTATGYTRLKFTNKYGQEFISNVVTFTLNYNKAPSISQQISLAVDTDAALDDPVTLSAGNNNILHEQMYLVAKCICTAYTAGTLTAKLYMKIGSTGVEKQVGATKTFTITPSTSSPSTSVTITIPYTGSTSSTAAKIGTISDTVDRQWIIRITHNRTTGCNTNFYTTKVQQHVVSAATLTQIALMTSGTYKDQVQYKYQVTNVGFNSPTITSGSITKTYKHLLYSGTNTFVANDSWQTESTLTTGSLTKYTVQKDTSSPMWASKLGKLKIQTIITVTIGSKTFTSTKTLTTNEIYAYNDIPIPTISYHQNFLGINALNVKSDSILDIRNVESTRQVILLGANETNTAGAIEINLVNNTIDIL